MIKYDRFKTKSGTEIYLPSIKDDKSNLVRAVELLKQIHGTLDYYQCGKADKIAIEIFLKEIEK